MWKRWIIVLLFVLFLLFLIPYSIPLILAFLTAVIIDGMVRWLIEKCRFKRIQAVITVFTGYVLLFLVIIYNLFSIVVEQTVNLSQRLPAFVENFYLTVVIPLIKQWELYSSSLPRDVIISFQDTLENTVNSIEKFANELAQSLFNLLTAIPGFLFELLIYLIALFLISLELPRLKEKLEHYFTDKTRGKFYIVTSQLNKAGIGFIKAQIILSLLTFTMAFTGLMILQVPYTVVLSLLIVVVDILPILGTGSVLVPWAIVAILQDNHFLGIGLIILFVVITIIRRIIEPKVYSSSLGITPLAALVSLYIGFKMLGLLGVFLGPLVVIVFDTLRKAKIIKMNFKL